MDAAERAHIQQAKESGVRLLNVQHNKPEAAPKPVKASVQKLKKPLAIHEDTEKQRWEVRCERACVAQEDRVRRFPWRQDKQGAFQAASAWVQKLTEKYF